MLAGDFITGFETGIFLRKQKDQLDDYKCPPAAIQIEQFAKIKEMLPNIKNIIVSMNNNDQ